MAFQICDEKINYSINNTGTTGYPWRKKWNEIDSNLCLSVDINQNIFQMDQMLNFKLSLKNIREKHGLIYLQPWMGKIFILQNSEAIKIKFDTYLI